MVEIIGSSIKNSNTEKGYKNFKTFNISASSGIGTLIGGQNNNNTNNNLIKPGYTYNSFNDFCANETTTTPYQSQAQIASEVFGEWCNLCSIPKQRGFLCSKCCKFSGQNEILIGCAGMRGGKTTLNSLIAAYHLHNLLAVKDVHSYFNIPKGFKLNFVFSSSHITEWDSFYEIWKNSPLLTTYIHKERQDYIEYDNIICYKTNKPSLKFPLIFISIGDYGWEDAATADRFKIEVDKNMGSLRGNSKNIKPLSIYSGSPKHDNDPLMTMLSGMSAMRTIKYHFTTWEMNPNITRADLTKEEQKDFSLFRRDYGALKI